MKQWLLSCLCGPSQNREAQTNLFSNQLRPAATIIPTSDAHMTDYPLRLDKPGQEDSPQQRSPGRLSLHSASDKNQG